VTGCIAIQVATALRDPIWSLFTGRPVTSVPALIALTFGAGLLVGVLAAAVPAARHGPPRQQLT
jgi:hypothetical protein